MEDPVVVLDGGVSRDVSVEQMVETLKTRVSELPADSTDSRCAAILLDIMPGFIKALDRERATFTHQIKTARSLKLPTDKALDDHMMVMTLPLVNMLGTALMALVPCPHDEDPCQRCEELRVSMMHHVLTNIERGVRTYVTKDAPQQKLHS